MTYITALQAIERQAAAGIAEAKALILVVDGQTGVTSSDQEVVSWLRKTHPRKPVRPLAARRRPGPPLCIRCSSGPLAPPPTQALRDRTDARQLERL